MGSPILLHIANILNKKMKNSCDKGHFSLPIGVT